MSDIAAAYDDWAKAYDTDANRTRDLAGAVLRQAALEVAGRDVLEIGCGTGSNTQWLACHSRSVIAVDFSKEMLRRAESRARASHVRFVQHDVRSPWPIAAASVDVIIATLVLEHVEHLEPVLAESARVLRSGGEMFLCELHPVRQLQGHQAQFTDPRTGDRILVQAFLHDTSEYVNLARQVGFQLLHMGEWRDPDRTQRTPPRLLSLHLRRTFAV
jgi:ubiquinone/menaquinone biosynthesis C-methylase UbiE